MQNLCWRIEMIECAVCHKLTDENHAEKINDFWICLICECSPIKKIESSGEQKKDETKK